MTTIGWMLTRMIVTRFLGILFGIAIFVLTLEVISYAKEILALGNGSSSIIFKYILMRAPSDARNFPSHQRFAGSPAHPYRTELSQRDFRHLGIGRFAAPPDHHVVAACLCDRRHKFPVE